MKSQLPAKSVSKLMKQASSVSALLKHLSHPQRLLILCALADGEKAVGEIEEVCGASQSAVSQFLKRMRDDGLVDFRRDGQFVLYEIADSRLIDLIKSLYRIYCD